MKRTDLIGIILGIVFGLSIAVCLWGCSIELAGRRIAIFDPVERTSYPTPGETATTHPAEDRAQASPAAPGSTNADQVVSEGLLLAGTLTGSPLLLLLGGLVGRFKPMRTVKTLIASQQAGRNQLKAHNPQALVEFDDVVRAEQDDATAAIVRKIKAKSNIQSVTGQTEEKVPDVKSDKAIGRKRPSGNKRPSQRKPTTA